MVDVGDGESQQSAAAVWPRASCGGVTCFPRSTIFRSFFADCDHDSRRVHEFSKNLLSLTAGTDIIQNISSPSYCVRDEYRRTRTGLTGGQHTSTNGTDQEKVITPRIFLDIATAERSVDLTAPSITKTGHSRNGDEESQTGV